MLTCGLKLVVAPQVLINAIALYSLLGENEIVKILFSQIPEQELNINIRIITFIFVITFQFNIKYFYLHELINNPEMIKKISITFSNPVPSYTVLIGLLLSNFVIVLLPSPL